MSDAMEMARAWLTGTDGVVLFGNAEDADGFIASLAALIAKAREEEREACAVIAKSATPFSRDAIAKAIRSRGES